MRSLLGAIYLCVIITLAAACDRGPERVVINLDEVAPESELDRPLASKTAEAYVFGFDLRSSPQEDARQYVPFLDYLARRTGYSFKLRFIPKYSDVVEELGSGKILFAAIGAGTYLEANRKYGVIPLARGLNSQGKAEYRAVIVVAPKSNIRDIHGLRGKHFAFGSRISTQGHLIPRIILAEHEVALKDLGSYKYTGSHLNCVNEVITGTAHACGMQDTMGMEYESRGLVRVIHYSGYYPSSGIVASRHVDKEVWLSVQKALLEFKPTGRDRAGLYHWDRTEMPNGFIEAEEEDYHGLIQWASKLGIIEK
jgi:phosphonate transport system substrate-binding protein